MPEKRKTQRPDHISLRGREAMRRYGFEAVPIRQIGSPSPGRVADLLSDLVEDLRQGIAAKDMVNIQTAAADLDELRLALDAWGATMAAQVTNEDRLAGGPLPGEPE